MSEADKASRPAKAAVCILEVKVMGVGSSGMISKYSDAERY
jgi:hypothetical protein